MPRANSRDNALFFTIDFFFLCSSSRSEVKGETAHAVCFFRLPHRQKAVNPLSPLAIRFDFQYNVGHILHITKESVIP